MTLLSERLGMRIKYIREERGMTQAELAEAAGLSDRYIRNLERGDRWARDDTVMKLCIALRVTIRELFDFDYP